VDGGYRVTGKCRFTIGCANATPLGCHSQVFEKHGTPRNVGWLQVEFSALGFPFSERGARTHEYIAAMRLPWSADKPTFKRRFVAFEVPIAGRNWSTSRYRSSSAATRWLPPGARSPAQCIAIARKAAKAQPREARDHRKPPDDLADAHA
jgi:hypothetical protein